MQHPPLHIGIVACSAEGAALCYRTICAEGPALLGAHAHPPVSMHTPPLAAYVEHLMAGRLEGVAALMLDSARRLQAAGADFLICPDNTVHQAFELVEADTPLPWLHIAQVAAAHAAHQGFRRVGILGTHWLTQSEVYPAALGALGLAHERPDASDVALVSQLIMDELTAGVFKDESTRQLIGVISRLQARGCDAVALACTELPLVLGDHNSPLPTLDTTRLLARAALVQAVSGKPPVAQPHATSETVAHLAQRIGA